MMNALGLTLKQWGSWLQKPAYPLLATPKQFAEKQVVSENVPAKLAISMQDLEHISEALLFYTKHLAKKKDFEKMEKVKRLDQRIYAIVENWAE